MVYDTTLGYDVSEEAALTIEQIIAKHQSGEVLTANESNMFDSIKSLAASAGQTIQQYLGMAGKKAIGHIEKAAQKEYGKEGRFEKLIHQAAGVTPVRAEPLPDFEKLKQRVQRGLEQQPQPVKDIFRMTEDVARGAGMIRDERGEVVYKEGQERGGITDRGFMPASPHWGKPGWLARPPVKRPPHFVPFMSAKVNIFKDQYKANPGQRRLFMPHMAKLPRRRRYYQ